MPGTHLTRRVFVGGTLARPSPAGGPSQLDTWDPKPDSVSAGPHKTIPTGDYHPGILRPITSRPVGGGESDPMSGQPATAGRLR
jgi:hypothetical protein